MAFASDSQCYGAGHYLPLFHTQLTSYLVTDVVDRQARRLFQIHNAMVLVHYLLLFHISLCSIHY